MQAMTCGVTSHFNVAWGSPATDVVVFCILVCACWSCVAPATRRGLTTSGTHRTQWSISCLSYNYHVGSEQRFISSQDWLRQPEVHRKRDDTHGRTRQEGATTRSVAHRESRSSLRRSFSREPAAAPWHHSTWTEFQRASGVDAESWIFPIDTTRWSPGPLETRLVLYR